MKKKHLSIGLLAASACCIGTGASANTAQAQLELTITLEDVFIAGEGSANFELFPGDVGADIRFEGIESNSTFHTSFSGSFGNGFGSASEAVQLAHYDALDPFLTDIILSDFDIGESLVITMEADADTVFSDSLFSAWVDSDITLNFTPLRDEDVGFTFIFTYQAVLSGTLDSTFLSGTTYADGLGLNVIAGATEYNEFEPGFEYEIDVFSPGQTPYFDLSASNDADTIVPVSDFSSGIYQVAFFEGDQDLSFNFLSTLVVSADGYPVPEPSSLALLLGGVVALTRRRRA